MKSPCFVVWQETKEQSVVKVDFCMIKSLYLVWDCCVLPPRRFLLFICYHIVSMKWRKSWISCWIKQMIKETNSSLIMVGFFWNEWLWCRVRTSKFHEVWSSLKMVSFKNLLRLTVNPWTNWIWLYFFWYISTIVWPCDLHLEQKEVPDSP